MIIEFLGTSGAGKSTLFPVLIKLLRDDGLPAMSAVEAIHFHMRKTCVGRLVCCLMPPALQGPILWRVFYWFILKFSIAKFAMENSRLTSYVVKSQLHRPIPRRHRWLILSLFFEMAGWYQFLKYRLQQNEALIFDEGFVHRATHIFVSESEPLCAEQIAAYLEWIPRSDLVIWVQAPLDACLARIYSRGLQVRLRNLETSEVTRFLANAEQVVNITAQYLSEIGYNVIQVENNSDLTTSTSELRRQLSKHLYGVSTHLKRTPLD